MPNDVLNNNELPDNQPMMSEQVHDDALDNEELLIDDGNDLNDSDIDDSDMDGDDDEAPVAGQAVPVIVDMTHVVTEDQAGLRIDKVA